MKDINNDILIDTNDYEEQKKLLSDEKKENQSIKKDIIKSFIFLLVIILIIITAYLTIYIYKIYGNYNPTNPDNCKYVNQKIWGSKVPNLNVSKDGSCKPFYNVDYRRNGKPLFNIDLFGNQTRLFNQMNQLDESGICKLNCDSDNDGWPDYNIDLDGDGIADINIIKDYNNKKTCDLNCDINGDMLADTNIDLDDDGIPDVNITGDDPTIPIHNIDYKGNRKPTFNIIDENGNIKNPINVKDETGKCIRNCTDEKGNVRYNVDADGDGKTLNDKVTLADGTTKIINIDVDGDGKADVNISEDSGTTIINPINKETIIEGKKIILNEDTNGDGLPDINIDLDNDGKPELNITDDTGKCIKNCDTNGDGKPDHNIYVGEKNVGDINIDTDYDGKCDVNCDKNYDNHPDINIDINGDLVPDINIDYDKDGKADFNIDTNSDGIPDTNIDVYGTGTCNFNCVNSDGTLSNPVGSGPNCQKNCDTTSDGLPNINVDIDNDGICDFNCDNGSTKIDSDYNYYEDDKYKNEKNILEIAKGSDSDFYIYNPLELVSADIEPGWNGTYVLKIKNDADYAVAYKIVWRDVFNDFTDVNNLDYFITRSNILYLNNLKAPRKETFLEDEVLIRRKTTVKYVLRMNWKETGINQNIDSGKTFKGKLYIETIK